MMAERAEYYFVYHTPEGGRIRIRAKRKPLQTTIPARGTWVVQEWFRDEKTGECKWVMPCLPEISFGRLRKMEFVRRESV